MKKLTTREKIILGGAAIALVVVSIKLKNDVFKAGAAYNGITNKLCSGGVLKATDICSTSFNLVKLEL